MNILIIEHIDGVNIDIVQRNHKSIWQNGPRERILTKPEKLNYDILNNIATDSLFIKVNNNYPMKFPIKFLGY